jgi:hypothetical protein
MRPPLQPLSAGRMSPSGQATRRTALQAHRSEAEAVGSLEASWKAAANSREERITFRTARYLRRWLTAPGAESPRHDLVPNLDGQTVGLDEAFDVNGFEEAARNGDS